MKKKLLILFIVAAGATGAAFAVKARSRGPEAVAVDSSPVTRHTIVQTVTSTGRIQPNTQVNISADVSAKITRLEVAEGDWVDQGQLLLELEAERYEAAVEVSTAGVRAAESNARLAHENKIKAEKDYERVVGLFERGLETQAALDSAYAATQAEKARHQSSLDQAEQAKASLKQIRDDLAKTRIFAPLSGTVSQLNKEVGEIALGSQFQEDVIMVISNLTGMEAVVDVDENDIVTVALGDEATIEVDALPGVVLKGQVAEIANSAKQSGTGSADQKTEFEVKIAISEPNSKLRPGMTASAEIVTETKTETVGVPIQCVAVRSLEQLNKDAETELGELTADKDGFVEFVFVVADGRSLVRPVKTGIQSNSHIEVIEGLSEDDQVIVGNYRAISKELQHGSLVDATAAPDKPSVVARK